MISHHATIKQLQTKVGHILAHVNSRPNGGLPRVINTSSKNDVHVMAIFTRSGWNFGKNVVYIDEDRNKRGTNENVNKKNI